MKKFDIHVSKEQLKFSLQELNNKCFDILFDGSIEQYCFWPAIKTCRRGTCVWLCGVAASSLQGVMVTPRGCTSDRTGVAALWPSSVWTGGRPPITWGEGLGECWRGLGHGGTMIGRTWVADTGDKNTNMLARMVINVPSGTQILRASPLQVWNWLVLQRVFHTVQVPSSLQ